MQLSFRMIKTDVLKMVIDVDNVRSEKVTQRGGTQQPSKRKGSQEEKSKGKVMPPIVPIIAAVFPCYTATDRRCRR